MATSYHNNTQRSQAVRSAQKLGSVFGATPRVVGNDGFDSLSRPSDSSECSTSPQTSKTPSHRSTKSFSGQLGRRKAAPAAILLVPMDHRDSHKRHTLPSPGPAPVPSPFSPSFENPPARRRAAQFAKLSRHLGENIPPEVLFGLPPTKYTAPSSPAASSLRTRGKSVSGPVSSSPTVTVHACTPTRGQFSRKSDAAVPIVPRDMPFSNVQWDGESSSSTDESADESTNWRPRTRAGRAETDWEGAWNRMSMGEVRNKLRALK